ncbi:hypothetical protein AA105894_1667 [Asaia spathodeae NBRC 105894]|nr:hypothetical protein AA105894_1667 [Asaia spathodeae NBRC 105894]
MHLMMDVSYVARYHNIAAFIGARNVGTIQKSLDRYESGVVCLWIRMAIASARLSFQRDPFGASWSLEAGRDFWSCQR